MRAAVLYAPHDLRVPSGGPVTLFEGTTPTGKGVFSLQLRTSGSGTQLRGLLHRSNGSVITGDWTRLSPRAHRITLHWVSGKPRGAAVHGSLHVLVDGRRAFEENANTATLKLGALRLGLVDGTSRTGSESAYLDGFSSVGGLVP